MILKINCPLHGVNDAQKLATGIICKVCYTNNSKKNIGDHARLGGLARASKMTKERRSEIAKKASQKRWNCV